MVVDARGSTHVRRAYVEEEGHGHKDARDGDAHEYDVDAYP